MLEPLDNGVFSMKIDQGQKRMISKEKAEDWARQQKMM